MKRGLEWRPATSYNIVCKAALKELNRSTSDKEAEQTLADVPGPSSAEDRKTSDFVNSDFETMKEAYKSDIAFLKTIGQRIHDRNARLTNKLQEVKISKQMLYQKELNPIMGEKDSNLEVINCRVGMIGFFTTVMIQLSNGQDVFDQLASKGLGPIINLYVLITVASIIPIFRGRTRRAYGKWTPDAEVILGRIAMLGFGGLVFWELIDRLVHMMQG